jgi:hypothetical protein
MGSVRKDNRDSALREPLDKPPETDLVGPGEYPRVVPQESIVVMGNGIRWVKIDKVPWACIGTCPLEIGTHNFSTAKRRRCPANVLHIGDN